ncbi:MAG: ArnT family glycosyltransferase [Phycisphaerales bacterium JB060]
MRVTHGRLAWAFVLLGCLACTVRYALGFPLIPDEAALAVNIARRSYEGLLGELEFGQMAPPLFLMVEEFATRTFGLNEWSLRAFPFLGAIGALVLFPLVVRRLLEGWGYVLAVAVFSVSYWPIRYSAEVKPYAVDMLVTVLWLLLALKWRESDRPWRWLVAMCPLAIVGFGVSFPSVFVGGAVVASMPLIGGRHGWAARLVQPGVVGICLLAGFVGAYRFLVPVRSETANWMAGYWQKAFPPTDSLASAAWWFLDVLTGELMPYPVGGENFASTGTLLCVVVGVVLLVRRRRLGVLVLLLGPVALALIAGFLQKYPFGTPTRLQLYLAPVFCVLAGSGLAFAMVKLNVAIRAPQWRSPVRVVAGGLALIAIASMARDVLSPQKSSTDEVLRDATEVIWGTARFDGPRPLSLHEDLGAAFVDEAGGMQSEATRFFANYHMRVQREGEDVEDRDIDPGEPVEVVAFHVNGDYDPALRERWIASFEAEHGLRLADRGLLTIPHVGNHEELLRYDRIEVLRFEPVASVTVSTDP